MSTTYNRGKYLLSVGQLDWDDPGTVIKAALMKNTYSASPAHNTMADIAAFELNSEANGAFSGYTAGPALTSSRKTLTDRQATESDANNRAELDNTVDLGWTSINAGTIGGVAIYKHVSDADDAQNQLICFLDVNDTQTNGGDVTLQFAAAGILNVQ